MDKRLSYRDRFQTSPFLRQYLRIWGIPSLAARVRGVHISRSLKNLKVKSILDCGCGLGCHFIDLKKIFPVSKIDCCDIDEPNLRFAENISHIFGLEFVTFSHIDLLDLAEKDRWDLIICSDVLEHIEDDRTAISNIRRALTEKGIFCVHVPKTLNSPRRFRRSHALYGHVREGYTVQEFKILLEPDFDIFEVRETFGLFTCSLTRFYEILVKYCLPGALLIFPFFLFLSRFDFFGLTRGRCLLILAQKK